MEKISVRRLAPIALAFLICLSSACQKKTETAAPASPPPAQTAATPAEPEIKIAPPITGPVTPALVTQDADSITRYLHFPKDAGKLDGAVQFYCDLLKDGSVETVHALVGNNEMFKKSVQSALDWGRFKPATVNGQPVRVYLAGTVLFLHQNNEEVIVLSLATHDRERVGKLENYIQPQMIGGLRTALQKEISKLTKGILVTGQAEVVVNVDDTGKVTGTSGISENPKGSGLGILTERAVKQAQFTPGWENGKKAAGGINVVANYSKF